jgi:hypothetical protein
MEGEEISEVQALTRRLRLTAAQAREAARSVLAGEPEKRTPMDGPLGPPPIRAFNREELTEVDRAPSSGRVRVPGVLFFYEDPLVPNASTIWEHVEAFPRHSAFRFYPVNLWFRFPPGLERLEFDAIVFHYTLLPSGTWVTDDLRRYVQDCPRTYKVAIFQDELWYFQERERMLTDLRVDCLYSRHKPKHIRDIYGPHLPVKTYRHYLAGYVSDDLVERSNRLYRPPAERPVDVAYRGRRIPFYMGRGGQEKAEIADLFLARAVGHGLRLDIAVDESDRLYGEAWDRFLASSRATLGVEGGGSVIDLEGRFRAEYERLVRENPALTFAQFAAEVGPDFTRLEDRIDYRSLTPRHFEAAAFRTLQILYEGRYDGILEPDVHYVPLKKDFSNFDSVLAVLGDPERCREITDRAYADLIASGKYTYQGFVRSFDEVLMAAGLRPDPRDDAGLRAYLAEWARFQSRVVDFEQLCWRLVCEPGADVETVHAARALLERYRPFVDERIPSETSRASAWARQARERHLWTLVERRLGRPVPARAQFDPRPSGLSVPEWLATVPRWWAGRAKDRVLGRGADDGRAHT